MVRETFGNAVDNALAQLEYAGVPRAAVAAIRQRLRRDKRIVAAVLALFEALDRERLTLPMGVSVALVHLRVAVRKARKREVTRV